MSGRRTLYERSPEELEALLIRCAQEEGPSHAARTRALTQAVAAAASVGAGVTTASAAPKVVSVLLGKGTATSLSLGTAAKLLLVSLVSGGLAMGGMVAAERLLQPSSLIPAAWPAQSGNERRELSIASVPSSTESGSAIPPEQAGTTASEPAVQSGDLRASSGSSDSAVDSTSPRGPASPGTSQDRASGGVSMILLRPVARARGYDGDGMATGSGTGARGLAVALQSTQPPSSQTGEEALSGNPRSFSSRHAGGHGELSSASPQTVTGGGVIAKGPRGSNPAGSLNPKAATAETPDPAEPSLTRELLVLESARAAIEKASPDQALQQLDQHRREFGAGRMTIEASALRVEALAATSRRAEAIEAADSFLARYPDSLLSDRVRSIRRRLAGVSTHR